MGLQVQQTIVEDQPIIPVRNAWYLLLYAWDMTAWKDKWKADVEASPNLLGLLARILAGSTEQLLRRQLKRAYEPHHEAIRGIRGRIDFGMSLKRRAFEKGTAHCSFYQLTIDTLKNRIIRSTINRIAKDARINHVSTDTHNDLIQRLRALEYAMEGVSLKRIESSDFSRLQITRNDREYFLPIAICYLIHKLEMPKEEAGDHLLTALLRDEITFHKLFELFIYNFYRLHLKGCDIGYQNKLSWFDEMNCPLVPDMSTDIMLNWPSQNHRLVIDAKYSQKTLATNQYGGSKFKSNNLYQIYTYLRTQEHRGGSYAEAQGMLLYPTTAGNMLETMKVQGHKIHIATVDLGKSWQEIEERMLSLAMIN